jgi:hypothetical protein
MSFKKFFIRVMQAEGIFYLVVLTVAVIVSIFNQIF